MLLTDGIHLISDKSEWELIEFAKSVGLPNSAYDPNPKHPHYDVLSDRIKEKIVKSGKVAFVDSKELIRRKNRSNKLKSALYTDSLGQFNSEKEILDDLGEVSLYNEALYWHFMAQLYHCPSLPLLYGIAMSYFEFIHGQYYSNFDSEEDNSPYENPFPVKSAYSLAELQKFTRNQLTSIGLWRENEPKPAKTEQKRPVEKRKWALR